MKTRTTGGLKCQSTQSDMDMMLLSYLRFIYPCMTDFPISHARGDRVRGLRAGFRLCRGELVKPAWVSEARRKLGSSLAGMTDIRLQSSTLRRLKASGAASSEKTYCRPNIAEGRNLGKYKTKLQSTYSQVR